MPLRQSHKARGNYIHMRRWLAVLLAGLLLSVDGGAVVAQDAIEWVPVPPQSLRIESGSPLDFSGLTSNTAAGMHGALRITSGGALTFADGTVAGRFHCGLLASAALQRPGFPTYAEADRLAQQLKRHGYSLARIHNLDYILTRTATEPSAIDVEQLDRFLYLLAALKRQGIYWMIDVLSRPTTRLQKSAWYRGVSPDDLRIRLHFDPSSRAVWLDFVDRTLGVRNRYTGLTTLADPALAFIVGANENSMAFAAQPGRPFPTGLDAVFDRFVRQRFATSAARAAITDLTAEERAGAMPIALPPDWRANGPRAAVFDLFVSTLEQESYRWMQQSLVSRGFNGPVLGYSEWIPGANGRTRASLPIVDVHAYIGEVSSLEPDARYKLPSLTSPVGLGEFLTHFGAQWLDRPMVATEYGQPFPNPYRHESGLAFPALAAFQGWSTLCRMAFLPVEDAIPAPAPGTLPMRAYNVGLDPNERAQETLSALLFLRGDVKPATRTVAVPFGETAFRTRGSAFLPGSLKRAALLARFGLFAPDRFHKLPRGALAVSTTLVDDGRLQGLYWILRGGDALALTALVTTLRADGTLSSSNRTDVARGLFESHDGQILFDLQRGIVTVTTPWTEAVASADSMTNAPIGQMRITRSNGGALIAASSLDGRPLATSRRILFIQTGDTRNKGMALEGTAEIYRLIRWGAFPLEMARIRTELSLPNVSGPSTLEVLALDGRVLSRRSVAPNNAGRRSVTLDTTAVPGQPTTFFLLTSTVPGDAATKGSRR